MFGQLLLVFGWLLALRVRNALHIYLVFVHEISLLPTQAYSWLPQILVPTHYSLKVRSVKKPMPGKDEILEWISERWHSNIDPPRFLARDQMHQVCRINRLSPDLLAFSANSPAQPKSSEYIDKLHCAGLFPSNSFLGDDNGWELTF
jgi:hypothetical protein